MRIIRPYGRSKTVSSNYKLAQRVLQQKPDKHGKTHTHTLESFSLEHTELIIAQWISTLDKIANKPHQASKTKGASFAQYQLRDSLGKAIKQRLDAAGYFKTSSSERSQRL